MMPKRVHPSTLTYPYRAAQVRGGTAGRLRSPTGQLWSVASHYRLYHVVLIKLRLELCVRLTEHDLTMSSARTRACLQADLHRPAVASVTSGKMNLPPQTRLSSPPQPALLHWGDKGEYVSENRAF
jgi:hypothetical protein